MLRSMDAMQAKLASIVGEVKRNAEPVATASEEIARGINESSRKIADIISVIDGIALQTHILALNAAVEAARAGEQGRGVAVVASEVRSLAQRSAQAAREIKGLIGTSVDRVEHGSSLVDDAGRTMDQATQQNAALVEQSAAAADSLKQQAQQLVQAVSAFRLR